MTGALLSREQRIERMLSRRLGSVRLIAEATYLRHNLSAILRSAEAFGVHNVHLITENKRKVGGAAKGAEKWVKIHRHETIEQCLGALRLEGFRVLVADLQTGAYTPDNAPIDQPLAVVLGTELSGVSAKARELADGAIIIPMEGMTQSLNVSVASACLLYRLSERRRALLGGGDLSAMQKTAFVELLKKRNQSG